MPEDSRAGMGAVLLAQIKGTPVIPVVLDIHSGEPIGRAIDVFGATLKRLATGKRPEATLKIGEPIVFEQIPKQFLDDFMMCSTSEGRRALEKQRRYESAIENHRKVRGLLTNYSERVMDAMADMLPPEKRGRWGTNNTTGKTVNSPQTTS